MGAMSTDAASSSSVKDVDEGVPPQQRDAMMVDGADDEDHSPVFVSAEDAVEVEELDNDMPMDDDDDDANLDEDNNQESAEKQASEAATDMSFYKIATHSGPVYAVASTAKTEESQFAVSLLTGGGDDVAFWHRFLIDQQAFGSMGAAGSEASSSGVPSVVESEKLAHQHTDSVSAVAWNTEYVTTPSSDDSKKEAFPSHIAAVGAYDGAICLYNAQNGQMIRTLEGPTDVECLAFHPKGGTVLLAGSAADGTLWMYHLPLNKCLQVFVGHESAVTACDFTTDGKWAVSASSDGTLRVWAPRTGACRHVFAFRQDANDEAAGLTCMAVGGGADQQLVVVGSEDGRAHVCHVGNKKVVANLQHFVESNSAMDTKTDDDGDEEEAEPRSVEAVGFSPAFPQWCATGGMDGILRIWDLAATTSGATSCRQACGSDSGGITRLKWHPQLPLCFTSTTQGVVQLWDVRNGTLLQQWTGHAPDQALNDMTVQFLNPSGDQALIVTGSDDHTVRVFGVDVAALWQQHNTVTTTTTGVAAAVASP